MFIFRVKDKTNIQSKICSAIKSRQIIEFFYHGMDLLVEPYCLGIVMSDKADNEGLLCYRVDSYGELGESLGWKLCRASEINNLRITDKAFSSDRPVYRLDNLRWKTIYCCVSQDWYDEVEPKKSDEPLTPCDFSEKEISTNIEPFTQSDAHAIKHSAITFGDAHATKLDTITDVDVERAKLRKMFTRSYIRMIKLSRKLNQNKNISGDIYFHPTERKIIVKSIDLGLPNTLCEVNNRPKARLNERNIQYRGKRWVEAYLIKQAKNNNWNLKLQKNEYRFLLSQLKFRRDIRKGERQGKILDLLLFNDKKQYLVVLELRSQADISVMNIANIELTDLITKIKIAIETGEIAEAFGLEEIKGIFTYLVCPRTDTKPDLGKYGLIEYDKIEKPWELYKESGKDLELRFDSKKGAFNLL